MRKLSAYFALWLLLLIGQHAAVVHEVSHVCHVGHADITLHAGGFAPKTCELCLGYSQLANPAAAPLHCLFATRFGTNLAPERAGGALPAAVLTPRSRGPPA